MAFTFNPLRVQEVTVNATMLGQQIINKFTYRHSNPAGAGGTSDFFLANFRDNYRLNILTQLYDDYQVQTYIVREIQNVVISVVGPPARFRNDYNVAGFDTLGGVTTTDAGQKTLAGGAKRLPSHEAVRVLKTPAVHVMRYWKANYNRFTSLTSTEKDTIRETWTAAYQTAMNTALLAFTGTAIGANAGGTITLGHCIWSAQYFGAIIKPAGGALRDATTGVDTMRLQLYVGTQVSRRFTPAGLPKGK